MRGVKDEYFGEGPENQKRSLSLSTIDSVGGNHKQWQLRGRDGEFLVHLFTVQGLEVEVLHWSPREIRRLSGASIYRRRALD
jgi:hypothetical protein